MSAPIESGESSDELDPESEDFDSLQALYSKKAVIPCPNVRVYDNVEQYESVIKSAREGTLRQRLQKAGRGKRAAAAQEASAGRREPGVSAPAGRGAGPSSGVAGPSPGAAAMSAGRGDPAMAAGPSGEGGGARFIIPGRRFTEGQAPVTVQRKTQRSVLTRMAATERGPSGRLKWCMDRRVKVKVYIRNYGRLRGVCIGYIVAFDKHWNLCLEDVDEIYQKKVRRKSVFLGDPDRVPASEERTAAGASGGQWPGQRARPSQAADRRQRDDRSWSPDRPPDRPPDRSSHPADRRLAGRSSSAGRYSGRDADRSATRVSGRDSGRDSDRTSGRALDRSSDRSSDRTSGRASGRASDRASTRPPRQAAAEDLEVARLTARMALLEPPRSRRSERRPVFETARRHVNQLFVRGDNVVLVAVMQGGAGDEGASEEEVQEVPVRGDQDVVIVAEEKAGGGREGGSDDEVQEVPVDTGGGGGV